MNDVWHPVCDTIIRIMEAAGVDVITVYQVAQAVDKATLEQPKAVLLKVSEPGDPFRMDQAQPRILARRQYDIELEDCRGNKYHFIAATAVYTPTESVDAAVVQDCTGNSWVHVDETSYQRTIKPPTSA